jgi:SAM-dependent methyltransferase
MSNHKFEEDLHQEMGLMTSYRWAYEPKGVLFMLSRYKFVAKLLESCGDVLEVGCGDGFGARLVRPVVQKLTCIDIDQQMIDSAKACHGKFDIEFLCTSELMISDAIYALDVIEHMRFEDSQVWLAKLSAHAPMVIIGTPSIESQVYASKLSRENHVNCMTQYALKTLMKEYFRHVLIFSMNDEMVHTGFGKMSHYNFAIGIN